MLNSWKNGKRILGLITATFFVVAISVTPIQAADSGTTVSGSVLDSNGNPVTVVVTLDQIQENSTVKVIAEQTTETDGSFSFLNVPVSATYQVSTKPSPAPNLTTAGRKAKMHSDPFSVDKDGTVLDEAMVPLDSIALVQTNVLEMVSTITTDDANPAPIKGAVAVLAQKDCTDSKQSPVPVATATSNTSGVVKFYAPETGDYCLQISDPTGLTASTSDSFKVVIPADGSDATSSANGMYTLLPAGNVQLKVISSATGKVISGAIVKGVYGDSESSQSVQATSNASGVATLKGIPDGTQVDITVSGPVGSSYIDNTTTATVIAGATVDCDAPSNGDTDGVVPLDSGFRISGTVRDGAGVALANIDVDVQSVDDTGTENPVAVFKTNSSGTYITNGLAPGTYNLHFSDTTSSLSQYRENVDLTDLVMADKALTNQNVVMRSCGAISGTVTGDNGDRLVNAQVSFRNPFGLEISNVDVDQDTANFAFNKVVPGKYSLKISAPGFRDKFLSDVEVTVNATTVIAATDSQLVSGSGITGRLVDTNAVPVINAQVAIYSAAGNGFLPLATTNTNTDGTYGFTNLAAGTYRLKFISGADSFPSFDTFWFGDDQANAASFATAGDLVTQVGVISSDINPVPVVPWASVTGNLTNGFDDTESPIALEGATVSLVSMSGAIVDSALTDSSGNFIIYAPTGEYRLQITASGLTTSFLGLDNEGNTITTIVAGDALLISFANGMVSFTGSEPAKVGNLPSVDVSVGGGTISVSVVDGTTPVTEGTVTVYDANGQEVAWVDVTDDKDNFVISGLAKGVKSAPYRVSYELQGQYSTVYFSAAATLSSARSIVVTNGKTTAIKITAVPLPSLDLELKATNSTAYSKKVTVEVYELQGGTWTANEDLSTTGTINPTTKLLSIKVSAGGQYRVRVVPEESRIAAVWLGNKPSALNIDQATTVSIPATGTVPKQTVLLNSPAIDVHANLTNEFQVDSVPTDIRQVSVTLTGNVAGKTEVIGTDEIELVGAGESVSSLFDHVPTSYFPITIKATSADAVSKPLTLSATDLTAAQSSHPDYIDAPLTFDSVVEPASLSGNLTDAKGLYLSDIVMNLVSDKGEIVDTTVTDSDGKYSFTNLPLGLDLTIALSDSDAYLKPKNEIDSLELTPQSGDTLSIDVVQHVAALYSGKAFGPDLAKIAGAQIKIWRLSTNGFDPKLDPDFTVYSGQDGSWAFDGKEFAADVGDFVFQIDARNSISVPAYYAPTDAGCTQPNLSCSSTSSNDAKPISTSVDSRVVDNINLVLQLPDTSAPTGVKWLTQPKVFGTAAPVWTWTGTDNVNGTNLDTHYVISTTSATAKVTGAWSELRSLNASTFKIAKPVSGTTYCLAIRMVDKSNNASSFISPSCTTVPLDDAKLVPTKKKDWGKKKAKDAYLGTLTTATKKSKSATLTAKSYTGTTICVLYTQDPKMGTFGILQGKLKKGKVVKTAGAHKAGQSVCVVSAVKPKDVISIVVQKAGNGVKIDGFAVLPKAPSRPSDSL